MVTKQGHNVLQASANILCGIVGAGMVTLPKIFSGCGWYGLIILPLTMLLCWFTGVCLGKASENFRMREELKQRIDPSYRPVKHISIGHLGKESMGHLGSFFATLSQIGLNIGLVCIFFALFGETTTSLVNDIFEIDPHSLLNDPRFWSGLCALALFPIAAFKTVKELFAVTLGGFLTSVYVAFAMVFSIFMFYDDIKLTSIKKAHNNEVSYTSQITSESFISSFGAFAFSSSAHALFLEIRGAMNNPAKFTHSLKLAYFALILIYLAVIIPAFYTYGNHLSNPNVSPSLLTNLPSGNVVVIIARIALNLHIIAAMIFVSNPFFILIETIFDVGAAAHDLKFHSSEEEASGTNAAVVDPLSSNGYDDEPILSKMRYSHISMLLLRWAFIASFWGLSVVVPGIDFVQSISGALFVTLQSFIMPCLIHIYMQPCYLPNSLSQALTPAERYSLGLIEPIEVQNSTEEKMIEFNSHTMESSTTETDVKTKVVEGWHSESALKRRLNFVVAGLGAVCGAIAFVFTIMDFVK